MKKAVKVLFDRHELRKIMFGEDSRPARIFDLMVIFAISLSLIIMLVESLPQLARQFKLPLEILEWVLTVFFTIEYFLRLYCSPRHRDYGLSFFGIIDFLATIPPYLAFFIPAAKYMLVFRAFRFVRVFRVFRLFSFLNEGYLLLESLRMSLKKILVYFLFVWILVLCIGTLMFIAEGNEPGSCFSDLPTSIYWAIVTLTTVGYGDITPVTGIGRLLSSLVMILGYTIIAVPTGIVSATIIDVTKEKVKKGLCPRCKSKVGSSDNYCRHCGEKL